MALEQAIETLNRAAAEERIKPESTLGVWVASNPDPGTDRERAHHSRHSAGDRPAGFGRGAAELRKIDRCIELAETRIEEKLAESAKRMAGLLAQEIKGVMVIRAKAYNREHAARLAGIGVLVFLAILVAGVVFDRTALARHEAGSIGDACQGHVSREPISGKSYCIIEVPFDGGGRR